MFANRYRLGDGMFRQPICGWTTELDYREGASIYDRMLENGGCRSSDHMELVTRLFLKFSLSLRYNYALAFLAFGELSGRAGGPIADDISPRQVLASSHSQSERSLC